MLFPPGYSAFDSCSVSGIKSIKSRVLPSVLLLFLVNPESCSGKAEVLCLEGRDELKYSIPSWTQRKRALMSRWSHSVGVWSPSEWCAVCWGFQYVWHGDGLLCFSEGGGGDFSPFGVSPSLGFDLQARLYRLATRQLSPMSPLSDVTAALPTSSSHFPENQWQLQWPIWGSYGTVPSGTHSMVRSRKASLEHVSKGQSKDLGSSPASLSFLAEACEHQVALLCGGTVV